MQRTLFIYIIFTYILCGCGPKRLSREDYSHYVSDKSNGLTKSASVGNTTITVSYRPTDLWVHQELNHVSATKRQITSAREKYSASLYFVLSFSTDSKETLHQSTGQQYSDLVQTLSFHMSDYVSLTTSANDTIPVSDFMLNRTYGIGGSTDLLFVFNKEKINNIDWIQFNLNEFGLGIGNQRFRFKTKDLDNCPEIKFETKETEL